MENRPVETYQVRGEDDVGWKLNLEDAESHSNRLNVAVKLLSIDHCV